MSGYVPPVRDIAFALDVAGAGDVGDREIMHDLVGEFGRFCADIVAPLNQTGDRAGVRFDAATGAVTTARGWKEAYEKYVAAGWNAVSFPTESGGGGFPWVLTTAMQEELNAASMAFALCPMLTQGAVHMLARYASEDQRAKYLAQLVSGEATGTMNLTEAGAGSDVGALTSRATPEGDGKWRIQGQKIFITYGEHDLSEQIIHLVLARAPQAPSGTKGITCFVVPKVLLDGRRNAVRCIGVEHKMGIHASPTCTLQFDNAVGEVVGGVNGGMSVMFTMMNNARLAVGVEGLGVAVRAYQAAIAYAQVRIQGGAPIIEHPDIRRMLLNMRSHIEAMRLLAYRTAVAIDTDDIALADLLTPVTKAWCTDVGAAVARSATQVLGGIGYIRDAGVEQHERDLRIASIYEGTNGIQAIDLVGRKLQVDGGRSAARFVHEVGEVANAVGGTSGSRLAEAGYWLEQATQWMRDAWSKDRRDALAGATPYLHLFGTTAAGWLLGKQVLSARSMSETDGFAAAKIATADYFLRQVVPQAGGFCPAISSGAAALDEFPFTTLELPQQSAIR